VQLVSPGDLANSAGVHTSHALMANTSVVHTLGGQKLGHPHSAFTYLILQAHLRHKTS
jgi:hypothetical protein